MKSELNLYYQDKHYSWTDLEQEITCFCHYSSSSIVAISAQQRFSCILYLLNGFINKKIIFPTNSYFIENDVKEIKNSCFTQDSALAIATSGSQAKPKIAIISRKNIMAHCQSLVKIIPIDSSSVWLNCLPLHHIAGVMILYRCWFNNASMLLHDDFDVQKVWHDIHYLAVTHISLVPRMLSRLLDYSQNSIMSKRASKKVPESLKYIIVGGDRISDSLFQRAVSAGWPIVISYGMTEATSTIAIGTTPDKLIPLEGFELQLSPDKTLNIKGSAVISASADPIEGQFKNGWFATNDRASWDGYYLSIKGRNDFMIISGGNNIAPEYIESLLSSAPVIEDIAIGKIYSNEWGDSIVALVSGDLDVFKTWIKNNIQSVYQPRIFIKVQQIPRNSMAKIDRKEVQKIINNTSVI